MTTPAHVGNKENAMSRDWTKEPWFAHGPYIENAQGKRVNMYDPSPANRERTAACVSACAPLSDPTASIPALLRVAEAAGELLLACCTEFIGDDTDSQRWPDSEPVMSGDCPITFGHLRRLANAINAMEGLPEAAKYLPASDERGGA